MSSDGIMPNKSLIRIVADINPRLCDFAAMWLIKRFGSSRFADIDDAKCEFWATAGKIPGGRSAEAHLAEGTLFLNIGDSIFRDLPPSAELGNRSVFDAVAKHLGLDTDLRFKELAGYVSRSSGDGSFSLAHHVRLINLAVSSDAARSFVFAALDAELAFDGLFVRAQETLADQSVTRVIEIPSADMAVCVVNSSLPTVDLAVDDVRVGIIVQRLQSGHVWISALNPNGEGAMSLLADTIRRAEAALNGVTLPPELAVADGRVAGAEVWDYQSPKYLRNGSFPRPDVPATKLPRRVIVQIVIAAVENMNK